MSILRAKSHRRLHMLWLILVDRLIKIKNSPFLKKSKIGIIIVENNVACMQCSLTHLAYDILGYHQINWVSIWTLSFAYERNLFPFQYCTQNFLYYYWVNHRLKKLNSNNIYFNHFWINLNIYGPRIWLL